ncbi:MAG: hypothetical protein LUE09_07930, partial [Synergistaceae bacterium]|nr:hypothetical protein [Synergistaceae bacterium]
NNLIFYQKLRILVIFFIDNMPHIKYYWRAAVNAERPHRGVPALWAFILAAERPHRGVIAARAFFIFKKWVKR